MKLKFLTLLAVVGMAVAACGSSDRKDENTDSSITDTGMSAMPDTTMPDSTAMDTTKNPVDTLNHK